MTYACYIASSIAAVALFMMTPRRGYAPVRLGALLGAISLGGLWIFLARTWLADAQTGGLAGGGTPYYYVFSALAIIAAVRVITHTSPVYAALWFVMVVMASSGLFLLLSAEFMAFAMLIIYGGAILVTYMFVIMLASHAGNASDPDTTPAYESQAREPAYACIAGFILLAALLGVIFPQAPMTVATANPAARALSDQQIIDTTLAGRTAIRFDTDILAANALNESSESTESRKSDESSTPPSSMAGLQNIERIGLGLFEEHPLGLELAGIILLVALIGAVVIARQQVDPQPDTPSANKTDPTNPTLES